MTKHSHRFCVAPMMDGTDRHCRYFHRLLSRRARLYSEMITAEAVIHGRRDFLIGFDAAEHPVALQLGGSNPELLAQAAKIGEDFGYDEINLNVGCPSDRVQSGAFGACLMKSPKLVADCVAAMGGAVSVPVTVKCRIGVDDQDPQESLYDFVENVAAAGCEIFMVHARKAWLQGLSPKENRDIPPLDYNLVTRLKNDNPSLSIILNGGITTIEASVDHCENVDGVMLGRAAYSDPYILSTVDRDLFGETTPIPSRQEIVEQMATYTHQMAEQGIKPHHVIRHMLGLFRGAPAARTWRRVLSSEGAGAGADILERSFEAVMANLPTQFEGDLSAY